MKSAIVFALLACASEAGTTVPLNHVSLVIVSLAASQLRVGDRTQATVVLKDSTGSTLTGIPVKWATSNATVASVNGASGAITALSAGTTTITAMAAGVSGSAGVVVSDPIASVATVTVTLVSPTIVVGGSTTALATLTDSASHVLTGRSIAWSSSDPSVATVDAATGAVQGIATGSAAVIATSEAKTGQATINVSAAPATATKLGLTTQPSSTAVNGQPLAQQPSVELRDASSASVGQAGVIVTASVASGGGTLGGTTTATTNASGIATFTNLSIIGTVGSRTLQFSAPGLTSVTSGAVVITAGAPAQLVITQQPSNSAQSGTALAQQPIIQLGDASGNPVSQSGILVTASIATGGGTLSGTTTATTNANGTASFSDLTITGSGAQTLRFTAPNLSAVTAAPITVSIGGTFATPDVVNNASFETGWDGFTDWSSSASPTGVSRATDYAYSGTYSVRRTWAPSASDVGSQFASSLTSVDRVWVRFYFRLTAPISSIMKFARFYNGGLANALGGLFIQSGNGIFGAGWDMEDGSIVTPIGLTQAQVIDGNWHSLEIEYWRNGDPSGYPSMAFWFDGNPLSLPDGSKVQYDCTTTSGTCNHSYWQGGRLYAGERQYSGKMNVMEWLATLNGGNTTTGQVNLDRIAISTLGRIGP